MVFKQSRKNARVCKISEASMPKKVLGLVAARWLSQLKAINVILNEWKALKLYFELSFSKEWCHTVKELQMNIRTLKTSGIPVWSWRRLWINKNIQGQNTEITNNPRGSIWHVTYRDIMQVIVHSNHLSKCFTENLHNLNILPHNHQPWPRVQVLGTVLFSE